MIDSFPWLDGFDYYQTDKLTYKWASANAIHVAPSAGRHNSGHIIPTGAGAYLVSQDMQTRPNEDSCFTLALAVRRGTPDAFRFIAQTTGNVDNLEFAISEIGQIKYGLTGGTEYSLDAAIPLCEWCHLTLYVDSTGIVVIRALNSYGSTICNSIITDHQAEFATSADYTSWKITGEAANNWQLDDCYIVGGDFYIDVLTYGDCRIDACEPSSDAVDYCDYDNWTFTLPGDPNYSACLAQPAESVQSTVYNTAFAVQHAGLTHAPETIHAVQTIAWATWIDPSEVDHEFQLNIHSGGDGTYRRYQMPATTETAYQMTSTLDPNGFISWTLQAVNAVAFGIRTGSVD